MYQITIARTVIQSSSPGHSITLRRDSIRPQETNASPPTQYKKHKNINCHTI